MYIEPIPSSFDYDISTESEGVSSLSTNLISRPSTPILIVIGITLIAVVWLGVYPAPLLEGIEVASEAILTGH